MIKRKIYKNGATLLYQKKKINCTTVAVGFIYGKNRDKYPEPVAHFCEHMLYKETQKHNEKQLSNLIAETFSRHNAHTFLFKLYMDFARSNKALLPCFDLSSEMLLNPKFTDKAVKYEKGVIKQELLSAMDNPKNLFYAATQRTLYLKYNKDTNIIGTAKEIEEITPDILKKFHEEVFISQNFIISIVGKISYKKAKLLTEKYFISKLKTSQHYIEDKTEYLPIEKNGNLNVEFFKMNKAMCQITFKINKENEGIKEKACLSLMSFALNNISTNLYNGKLRKNGLTYNAWFDYSTLKNKYTASFYFESSKENINKIINLISKILLELKTDGIDNAILENIKKQIKYNEDETGTTAYPSASMLLESYLFTGDELLSKKYAKESKKTLFKTTQNDIKSFCQKIFSKEENIYVTVLGNLNKSDIYSYKKIQKLLSKVSKHQQRREE